MFFTPSPAVNKIATLNKPDVHVVEEGLKSPVPDKLTERPASQVPVRVKPICALVPVAGLVRVRVGAVVSRAKSRLDEDELPAVSV